jgi:hypothetical protein
MNRIDPNRNDKLENLKEIKHLLRSTLAFILFLRYPAYGVDGCYNTADKFIKQLEDDIKND